MFDEAKRKQKACCVLAVEAGDVGVSAMRDCRGCHEVVYLPNADKIGCSDIRVTLSAHRHNICEIHCE
jgi:hypothetical protein